MGQCREVSPMVLQLKNALKAEGTGSIFSLSQLRRLVALSSNNLSLCSGQQQDAVEFLTFLINSLPVEFFKIFEFTEHILRKFVINGEHVPCPRCNTLPSSSLDTRIVLELPVSHIVGEAPLTDLIKQHFSPEIAEEGKRCDGPPCCPHGTRTCPGTDSKCKSLPYSQQRHINQYPNYLFIQLKRFCQTMSGQFVKSNTPIMASETLNLYKTHYQLIGIINHLGTFEAGHYFSIVKHLNDWIIYDDYHQPRVIPLEKLFSSENYMFLFKKLDHQPQSKERISSVPQSTENLGK